MKKILAPLFAVALGLGLGLLISAAAGEDPMNVLEI